MLQSPTSTFAPFAAMPHRAPTAAQHRPGFAAFFLAPFRDVDVRAAHKLAAQRAEREARQAAMAAAPAARRA